MRVLLDGASDTHAAANAVCTALSLQTPLHVAVAAESIECIKEYDLLIVYKGLFTFCCRLLTQGADASIADANELTPIDMAMRNDNESIAELLTSTK